MFDSLLIANRGEIACRVIRTARRLGIRTIAVYSEADARSRHVAMADRAVAIGPAPARESYLSIAAVLKAAKEAGAQAIHPGYGFLSENADFAQACQAAGIVFVGPPVEAIRIMGSKSESKRLMEKAGVPLVPGYHGTDQSDATLAEAARAIGFPVLVKASAGGGGKGMRVVREVQGLAEAIAGARREAKAAFGDDSLLVEKYLDRPRHVEIQIFADGQGRVVHLFERDCSLQRRHQKVIEEAPAPGLDPNLRASMGRAAVAAAAAVGYVGAGTVEFLKAADGSFYFIEMNTRLQVEHPVTEMITGQDLVEWQLRVAAGEPLPLQQNELAIKGHAFEARIYAEDPARDFLPATGRLVHLRPPTEGPHVRVDTGVGSGDEISIHYDPMIAKLICWDADRNRALQRLKAALADYQVVGVATNLAFLGSVAAHPAFAEGAVDTGFFERHKADLFPEPGPASERVLALASLDVLLERAAEAEAAARQSSDPHSPWHTTSGWRLNDDNHHVLIFKDGATEHRLTLHYRPQGWVMDLPSGPLRVNGVLDADGTLRADLGGIRLAATVIRHGDERVVMGLGPSHRLILFDPAAQAAESEAQGGSLVAPMPGKVTQVFVKAGDRVARGAPLLVIEAMKMEHTIRAPADGVVAKLNFAPGDQASDGDVLLAFADEEGG
ncbi:MAG: acetyl/propionyl/methylcrotonyl-CoA carboxylase subunit alpha [Rhodospirillales bacterium]|nr:acetyl/propionyl/methylcrotonyl-CoA carboxylase subunit alpha [Rhodospirillales bacterium]